MLLIAAEQAPHFGPQILQLMLDLLRPGQRLRGQDARILPARPSTVTWSENSLSACSSFLLLSVKPFRLTVPGWSASFDGGASTGSVDQGGISETLVIVFTGTSRPSLFFLTAPKSGVVGSGSPHNIVCADDADRQRANLQMSPRGGPRPPITSTGRGLTHGFS